MAMPKFKQKVSFSDLQFSEIILKNLINSNKYSLHMTNRPSWDEYFINIANEVSKRATCDRGKSGCVIVKDKHILTTGYVGSPAGLPHCDEVGHLFKTTTHENGKITQHCMRTTHAEQNAICQSAKF